MAGTPIQMRLEETRGRKQARVEEATHVRLHGLDGKVS